MPYGLAVEIRCVVSIDDIRPGSGRERARFGPRNGRISPPELGRRFWSASERMAVFIQTIVDPENFALFLEKLSLFF